MNVFGPVPSRRLGKSIGINNIPPKICTYACVYCQLGRALKMTADRQPFYSPLKLLAEVREKIKNTTANHESIDYLTIVSDGEPTLDQNLGQLLELLKSLDIKTAVITNASLLNRSDVRDDLAKADWVSVKVDSVVEPIWRKTNRPLRRLNLEQILAGIQTFARNFQGQLTTETMLVQAINTAPHQLVKTAQFLQTVQPDIAYLSIPTRPPAETWANAPAENIINQAYQIFADTLPNVEYLIGYEGNKFAYTGNIEADILSITAVHPMREDAIQAYLKKAGGDFSTIKNLIDQDQIIVQEYQNNRFYLRKLSAL